MTTTTPSELFNNKKAVPKEFNRVAKKYDFATGMSQGYFTDLKYSASLLNLKGNEQVLDLCCGTGKSTAACLHYLNNGGKITGVDNSEGMLQVAKEKFKSEIEQKRASFSLQDGMELYFPDNSFDAIFVAYGLRNMPDYDKFIKGLYRILKPGGKLCIHDYSIVNKSWARWFWLVLGYGFIVPFCTIVSRSSTIYLYLIKSVANFMNPMQIKELLKKNKFEQAQIHQHSSWRKPILHSFTCIKPKL